MNENQFVVDLGAMKLTDDQRSRINAAIQKAVAGELATLDVTKKIALLPVTKWKDGPIINGIIIRDLGNMVNDFVKIK